MSSNTDKNVLVETITFAAGPVLSLVMAWLGQKTWLRYEFISCLILNAIMLIKPEYLFESWVTKPLLNTHLFLIGLYGCYLVYVTLYQVFVTDKDQSIYFGHYCARIVASVLIIADNLFSYTYGEGWNYRLLCFSVGNGIVDFSVSVYFLIKTKRPKWSNQIPHAVNHIAKVEAAVLFAAGIILYAFPDQAMFYIKNTDDIHRSLIRTCGALVFSLGFESLFLTMFAYVDDKKRFMLGRLVGSLFVLVVIMFGFLYYKVFSAYPALTVYLVFNMSYNLIVVFGFIATLKGRQDTYRRTDSISAAKMENSD